MPLIAFAGEPFGRNTGSSVTADRLQQMEEIEADPLLQGHIPVDYHIGVLPKIAQVIELLLCQHIETVAARLFELLPHNLDIAGLFRNTAV